MMYKITTKDKIRIFQSPCDVYEYIVTEIYKQNIRELDEDTHIRAADAQCWCELATAGEELQDKLYTIECVYNF